MLRKPPRRSAALLAAKRANALKSTGPRSQAGKRRSSINAWRHGWRTQVTASCKPEGGPEALAFANFKEVLRGAILPAENDLGRNVLASTATGAWKVKRNYDRWLAARTRAELLLLDAGALTRPPGWRLTLKCRTWWVTISVWVRRNRAAASARMQPYLNADFPWGQGRRAGLATPGILDLPRQHTVVKVTCFRHPWINDQPGRRLV